MRNQNIISINSSIESANAEIVKFSGPSNSGLLSTLHKANSSDVAAMFNRLEAIEDNLSLLANVVATQGDTVAALITSLQAQLPVLNNRWLIDFYTLAFIHNSNTASINTTYGQATLPVTTTTETLIAKDVDGIEWIPDNTRIDYAYTERIPSESDWRPDSNATNALINPENGIFWVKEKSGNNNCWIRVRPSPQVSSNHLSNVIILHPYPSLGLDIKSVQYRTPSSGWIYADLSYNWNWDATNSKLTNACPLRIFIPPTQVVELLINLDLSSGSIVTWGFSKISLQFLSFTPTATLAVDFNTFNPSSVNLVNIFGQDRDVLNYLVPSIVNTEVSVNLTQITQGTTPVITGIEGKSA